MKPIEYRQCRLVKGSESQISWIPERFADVGMVLKLREDDSSAWNDGWIVEWVSSDSAPEPAHFPHVRKQHRRGTGDSLPK